MSNLFESRLVTEGRLGARAGGRFCRTVVAACVLALPLITSGVAATPALATDSYVVTATIPVGDAPAGVAVDPSSNTIYVANLRASTVSVIDGATNTVTANIPVDGGQQGVVVDPSTNTIYAANLIAGTVSVIDGTTNTVTATIIVGGALVGVAVNSATNTIYVVGLDTTSVIDGATNTVTTTIPVGSNTPGTVAVNPVTNTIYVADFRVGTVSVIDGATNEVTAAIPVEGARGVAVNPATNTIYVTRQDTSPGTVSVIDGATNTVTATITVGTAPDGLAVDPSTNTIYVTNSGSDDTVSVIDGATNNVTATVPVGSIPVAAGVNPATHAAYVANNNSNTVSVITPVSDSDLALSQPPDITTDATGPSGTTVTYDLPVVTDEDTPLPVPVCSPASGSVFAIGTTMVTCSVTSPDDTPSTVSVTFTVTVKSAEQQAGNLQQAVEGLGPGPSLLDKVAQAKADIAAGHTAAACGTLRAFINEVKAQTGKKITETEASTLVADAQRIQAVLVC